MIAFRDFSSVQYGRPEGLDRALVEANEWLLRTGVEPLNIETLKSPFSMTSMHAASSDIGLRIWYLVPTQRPA